jgi:hypothetical protein
VSTDGGSVWTSRDAYYGSGYDLTFGGGSTFWYIGYKYTSPNYEIVISKTENNGTSWTRFPLSSGADYRYPRVLAVDPSNTARVFVLAYEASAWKVYWTQNGGTSWQSVAASGWSGTPYRMLVSPSDASRLAAASSSGLYTSANGGATWTRVTTAFGSSTEAVLTGDGSSLIVGTSSQGIWKWVNWTGAPAQIGSNPTAITALNDSPSLYLYAGTPASSVWRSYNGTGTEESSSTALPGFSLTVMPNPVSGGMAAMSFALPSSGETRLLLFDVTGRLEETVTSAFLPEGEHSISFSTEQLSPGVYFARLEQGGSCATARMVVTR